MGTFLNLRAAGQVLLCVLRRARSLNIIRTKKPDRDMLIAHAKQKTIAKFTKLINDGYEKKIYILVSHKFSRF